MTLARALDLLSVFPQGTRVDEKGHLILGGCDSVDLAASFGTPLYVFDEAMIRRQCRDFRDEFRSRYPQSLAIYANKAFSHPAVARILAEEGLGMDVVSGGEIAVAQSARFPGERIYFHGNNKTASELRQALDYKVGRIVVDGFNELNLLEDIAAEKGLDQDILLRITPGVDAHTHAHITTGVFDSKFGFPLHNGQAEEALRLAICRQHLNLIGLHCHIGSQVFEVGPYQQAIEVMLRFAAEMRHKLGFELMEFSPGGGFAVQYLRDYPAPPVSAYAEAICSGVLRRCKELELTPPRLVVEPGRAIVGRAGVALYTIGAIKDIPGVRKYVSVDGGMGDNIRPALYDARYEALLANRASEAATAPVTICGRYCESGDILIKDAPLPEPRSGDLLAIPVSGAYCPTMASNYNNVPRPAMAMVKEGQARVIRRRETFQDIMSRDSE
ncbi:MAG: diaminopimelate decarboxylase [Chloroflexi bacterium]|nr:diaminopimelate decarboxylase [Chloroflexota bacterium]